MHFIPHLEKDIRRHWRGLAHNTTSTVLLQSQANVKGPFALNMWYLQSLDLLSAVFKLHVRHQKNRAHWQFDNKTKKPLSAGLILREGWQCLIIPLTSTASAETSFEDSIRGFPSPGVMYVWSTRVLKCGCTVQMISTSVRKSAPPLQTKGEWLYELGHLVSRTRWANG